MKLPKAIFMLPLLLLITLAASSPDEATGRVAKVVDGDTLTYSSRTMITGYPRTS
jgi:endonuclease YncB( thermonuclease family)